MPFVAELAGIAAQRTATAFPAHPDRLDDDVRAGLAIELRDHYLARAEAYGLLAPGVRFFTDKMPLNELYLPLLRLAFPVAPLVTVRRHPLDVMVSAMSHDFTHGFHCGYRLEDVQKGREERLPQVLPQLEPLRQLLKDKPWLGGDAPNYADYCVLSSFLWCASIATTPPMTEDDPLRDWLDRGFDLYGGLGRHPGMRPLFGLKLKEGDPEPFHKPGSPFLGGAGSAAVRARMQGSGARKVN